MIQQSIIELSNILPVISYNLTTNETTIVCKSENLNFCLFFLKKHSNCRFNLLSCISGVDLLDKKHRFCISYDLLSLSRNTRLRVKTFISEVEPIISSTLVFINANWWEREIWDLFGVYFLNHNDLRRILTDYGFEGYPLRKDFPCSGYLEMSYVESQKRVMASPISLAQSYRAFDFQSPHK
jgi:NADH/F420H2 dehydrogenase subunit C